MALTSTPTDYANLCTGRLAAKISPTTATGITVTADTFKTPAGTSAATWPTGAQIWKISRKTRTTSEVEFVGVETASQSGSTVTTGTVNRYLPANGSSLTSQGDGLTFPAGSVVELVWHAYASEKVAYKDVANTFSAKQTFSVPFRGAVYATSGDLPSGGNGDGGAYVTADGVFYDYIAGTWSQRATGTTANGSTTVAGKFEEATVAEQGTATATGATGARLVPAVANLVKTSSGASDENKIPLLNADGALHINHIATGTPDGTKFVRDDGVLATPTASTPLKYANIVDSNTVGSTSSETDFDTNYTIPAGDLTAGIVYQVKAHILYTQVGGSTQTVRVKMGSTTLLSFAGLNNGTNDSRIWELDAIIICRTTGASGTVYATGVLTVPTAATAASISRLSSYGSSTINTTGTNVLKISDQPSDTQANTMIVKNIIINKLG